MKSAEKFDFGPKWKLIASLKSKRCRCCCIIHKGYIYISGCEIDNVDIYNPVMN